MRRDRGLTLLELILALTLLGSIALVGSTLYTASIRAALVGDMDIKMQNEIAYMFRDFELYIRNGISGGVVTQDPDGSGDLAAPQSGPLFYRNEAGVWLGFAAGDGEEAVEIWYGYKFEVPGDPPVAAGFVRKIYKINAPHAGWGAEVVLSKGLVGPYAEPVDENGNEIFDPAETTKRDVCLQNIALTANCEGATPAVYPVFRVSPDKKIVYVSLKAKGTLFGMKEASLAGMTRGFYLHASSE